MLGFIGVISGFILGLYRDNGQEMETTIVYWGYKVVWTGGVRRRSALYGLVQCFLH